MLAALFAAGCGGGESPPASPPATVSARPVESQLATIHLTAEAERRLGIEVARIEERVIPRTRTVGGDVVAPPGRAQVVTAPIAGSVEAPNGLPVPAPGDALAAGQPVLRLVVLPGDRDLARAQEDVDVALARARLAGTRAVRARELRQLGLASVQDEEIAIADEEEASATLRAAQARLTTLLTGSGDSAGPALTMSSPRAGILRQLLVGTGQTVAAGTPLFEVVSLAPAWVRVPVYVGDVSLVAPGALAWVSELSGGRARAARPVTGPPTADAAAASADLYYELPAGGWRLGQRVAVTLAQQGTEHRLAVPAAAVVYDISGGTWVYERTADRTYVRRRVELAYVTGDLAVLARGPSVGAVIVTTGAAELFGTEFGIGR